jgi:REP element-mobilizing transposase RayT
MKFDPLLHHRRSIRLKGYDYSQEGAYFITICCHNRICRFGEIVGAGLAPAQMQLNEYGNIAYNEWAKLPERFPNLELDVFQIMPNHMHGIIVLNDVGAGASPTPIAPTQFDDIKNGQSSNGRIKNNTGQPQGIAPTVGDIVGAYKSLVANGCLKIFKINNEKMGKLWQRDYYEHIIRDDRSYQTISEYITNNPSKWADDKFYKF